MHAPVRAAEYLRTSIPKDLRHDSSILPVRPTVPKGLGEHMSDQITGEVVTALFGDCALPERTKAYLTAHGIDLAEFAARVDSKYKQGVVPPTTRVSTHVANRLKRRGMNCDQYGKIKVLDCR
jgi:hypothetical protein